ncbi:lytic transglycosylase domain-containing protein [Pseudonocardia acaciae]|uniref:lytic transglycosylase domain-containing protein n=1 Tax=Pseudonocardia acaciae TaxID=551276 RepID=UPI00048B83FC|nr:lytic transglycosylase domain-containing protein [Pseudonocardia acaciae]
MRGGARWYRGLGAIAAGLVALLVLLIIGAAEDDTGPPLTGVDPAKIPPLARQMLPVIDDVVSSQCPELPPVWVVAEIMAESSWNPNARSSDSNGGAFGLYQINARNWAAAGGRPGDIYVPETHLRVGIPWVCANLRAVTGHVKATGKPTSPLDAMLVCHIAGCGRVTGSATGVPKPGEASCGGTCVGLINRYLANIHRYVEQFSAPVGPPKAPPPPPPAVLAAPAPVPVPAAAAQPAPPAAADAKAAGGPPAAGQAQPAALGAPGGVAGVVTVGGITTAALPAAPAAFTGPKTGCTQPDPTTKGCLTAAAKYGYEAQVAAFNGGGSRPPSIIRASCWDPHAWNPSSDHAKGKACDLFPGAGGKFAKGDALEQGWRVANWYRTNAAALHVKYLIWQGRYWDVRSKDQGGWGDRYDGAGVYNVKDPTGGHFDHVHVSFAD